MDTAKAIEMFRTLPADEHPGGLAECAGLVLAELDRRGAAIERVRALHERYADGSCFECGKNDPCPTIAALDGGS